MSGKLEAKQRAVYMDRSGDQRPLVAIRANATNPEELADVEYAQANGSHRIEPVLRASLERLVIGVDKT